MKSISSESEKSNNQYNIPRINKYGRPICEICEVGFDRLLQHVNKRHGLNAKTYKAKFNYNPRKGIQSDKLRRKSRKNALDHFNKVIMENLIIKGRNTRFKEANKATPIEKLREINRVRMTKKWQESRIKNMSYWENFIFRHFGVLPDTPSKK